MRSWQVQHGGITSGQSLPAAASQGGPKQAPGGTGANLTLTLGACPQSSQGAETHLPSPQPWTEALAGALGLLSCQLGKGQHLHPGSVQQRLRLGPRREAEKEFPARVLGRRTGVHTKLSHPLTHQALCPATPGSRPPPAGGPPGMERGCPDRPEAQGCGWLGDSGPPLTLSGPCAFLAIPTPMPGTSTSWQTVGVGKREDIREGAEPGPVHPHQPVLAGRVQP